MIEHDHIAFYRRATRTLLQAGVPVLVGGAYALEQYTGIRRDTKDFDLFLRRRDLHAALHHLARAGYETFVQSPIWLGKARSGGHVIDLIFSSGNGMCEVDDEWFAHAVPARALGMAIELCPPEETIWSKGYVMERDRFDGADVNHLIRACGHDMDWQRLLRRFGDHWVVLLAHVALFTLAYPGERDAVPPAVRRELATRFAALSEAPSSADGVCGGLLLSRHQYRVALEAWGYADGRLPPSGRMTREQAALLDAEP